MKSKSSSKSFIYHILRNFTQNGIEKLFKQWQQAVANNVGYITENICNFGLWRMKMGDQNWNYFWLNPIRSRSPGEVWRKDEHQKENRWIKCPRDGSRYFRNENPNPKKRTESIEYLVYPTDSNLQFSMLLHRTGFPGSSPRPALNITVQILVFLAEITNKCETRYRLTVMLTTHALITSFDPWFFLGSTEHWFILA